ncbi:MAG: 4-alpha-glucanotransferase [Alphaproteobacteria bacterium]|nr:4-alpha-glucanotransferase [Alphaproteobacteria bacterium]
MDRIALARTRGIIPEYFDALGKHRVSPPEALEAILAALPHAASPTLTGGAVVIRGSHEALTEVKGAVAPLTWKIVADGRTVALGESADNVIRFPGDLSRGCYRLEIRDGSARREDVPLVVTAERAFGGNLERGFLVAAQLYGIRSSRNWGIGDFSDLCDLIDQAAAFGADGVGLNPLHVLFDDRPGDCSPYSPNSRLFLNPLYINVENVEEYRPELVADAAETAARLRQGDRVPYAEVAELKWRALRAVHSAFRAHASPARRLEFERFQRRSGPLLARFACFEVLRHRFRTPWWEWPQQWQQMDARHLRKLRHGPARHEVEFVEFVQWIADQQLSAARARAQAHGMRIGLYLDVAVGVCGDGFDAWNEQVAISRTLSVGAPPDVLNTVGQDWGLAGFNAPGLEARSFVPFAEMLGAAMRYAGAIRLDHVLGLMRLFLVPQGFAPDQGAYVKMPLEALLAIVARESTAHRCIVIGEDLGTVPEGFRDILRDWGIWSYLVMMFERDEDGRFRDIARYATEALVTLNTHDLATYAGWRSFSDMKMKRSLGLDPGESDQERWDALGGLDDLLGRNALAKNDLFSVLTLLARAPSRLLVVSLEDLLGVIDQPNVPGTVDQHPNWRQRLPVALADMSANFDVAALKAATSARQRGT